MVHYEKKQGFSKTPTFPGRLLKMTVWIMVFTSFPLELGGVWAPKVPPPQKGRIFKHFDFFRENW